jgi:hypothetical protein
MNRESDTGTLTNALYQPIDGISCERAAALGGEHEGTVREKSA